MQEQPPAPENKRHYAGLDGLRGVAVLMVMFEHYTSVSPAHRWGWTGVRIFFVLSGFLITGILYDTRNADRRWSVFYARRSLRIFPLYYGVLLLAVALYPLCRWAIHPSYLLWPFYLQNYARFIWPADIPTLVVDHLKSTRFTHPQFLLLYGHFWSLCVEEQFYLIWPPIVFAVRRRETLMKICLAVVLLSPVIRLICSLTLSPVLLNAGFEERFTLLQCDGLLLGGFFALWLRGPTPDLSRLARRMLAVVAGITLIAKILCPILYHRPLLPSIGDWIFASLGYSCVNVAAAAIVLLAIDPRTLLSKALQQRNLRWLGTISYGFYVLHDLPHVLYYRFAQSITHGHFVNLTAIAFGFTGTLLLASLSYYGFERPFLNLKRRFTIKPALASSSLGAPQGNGTAP